jgi:uncharacterized PurR-regulated membrane protein YhhQ (DUF165 family)
MTERRKIIRLALLVPWIALALTLVSLHLHGIPLRIVVGLFVLVMASLLAYVIPQMMKARKRSTR